jgi:hypothetical protein
MKAEKKGDNPVNNFPMDMELDQLDSERRKEETFENEMTAKHAKEYDMGYDEEDEDLDDKLQGFHIVRYKEIEEDELFDCE